MFLDVFGMYAQPPPPQNHQQQQPLFDAFNNTTTTQQQPTNSSFDFFGATNSAPQASTDFFATPSTASSTPAFGNHYI